MTRQKKVSSFQYLLSSLSSPQVGVGWVEGWDWVGKRVGYFEMGEGREGECY